MTALIRRNTRPSMLIPIIFALFWLGPSAVMKYVWIDLRSVHVTGGLDAFAARVDVDRTIRLGFPGSYSVSVRRVDDDLQVCAVHSKVFDYRGGLSKPVEDMPISWWMQGYPPLSECIRDGFRDDEFYLTTCHDVVLFRALTFARRCVQSNTFKIGEAI